MIIKIKNLTFQTIIGVLDFERVTPQKVVVNLKAHYNYKNGNYINYVTLTQLIKEELQKEKFELLEDAINHLIKKISQQFPNITKLKIEIIKPEILKDCQVSLTKKWKA